MGFGRNSRYCGRGTLNSCTGSNHRGCGAVPGTIARAQIVGTGDGGINSGVEVKRELFDVAARDDYFPVRKVAVGSDVALRKSRGNRHPRILKRRMGLIDAAVE